MLHVACAAAPAGCCRACGTCPHLLPDLDAQVVVVLGLLALQQQQEAAVATAQVHDEGLAGVCVDLRPGLGA